LCERADTVRAAGAVVLREGVDGLDVLVVHRPRDDDWSLPKGKVDGDEGDEAAAVREVREETGYDVALGHELPSMSYTDRDGRPKVVRFWVGTPTRDSGFVAGDEVDGRQWWPIGVAVRDLTYAADRELVAIAGSVDGTVSEEHR
jgi:8-oxo-dGTP diphosphatase